MKKSIWVLFAALATVVGFYPAIYFIVDRKFGLLSTKTAEVLTNLSWNI